MSGVECGLVCCRLVRFGGRLVGGVVADGDAPEVLVAVTDRERDGGEFDRSAVERACSGPSCGGLLRLDPADVADREAPPLGVVPVAVHRRGGYQPARDPVRGCLLGFEVWGEVAVIDPFEAEVLLGVVQAQLGRADRFALYGLVPRAVVLRAGLHVVHRVIHWYASFPYAMPDAYPILSIRQPIHRMITHQPPVSPTPSPTPIRISIRPTIFQQHHPTRYLTHKTPIINQ